MRLSPAEEWLAPIRDAVGEAEAKLWAQHDRNRAELLAEADERLKMVRPSEDWRYAIVDQYRLLNPKAGKKPMEFPSSKSRQGVGDQAAGGADGPRAQQEMFLAVADRQAALLQEFQKVKAVLNQRPPPVETAGLVNTQVWNEVDAEVARVIENELGSEFDNLAEAAGEKRRTIGETMRRLIMLASPAPRGDGSEYSDSEPGDLELEEHIVQLLLDLWLAEKALAELLARLEGKRSELAEARVAAAAMKAEIDGDAAAADARMAELQRLAAELARKEAEHQRILRVEAELAELEGRLAAEIEALLKRAAEQKAELDGREASELAEIDERTARELAELVEKAEQAKRELQEEQTEAREELAARTVAELEALAERTEAELGDLATRLVSKALSSLVLPLAFCRGTLKPLLNEGSYQPFSSMVS
eukprot:SAG22_NODE_225_length_14728_cov_58.742361_4_plen_421_part_00